jgi:hypothetical protein
MWRWAAKETPLKHHRCKKITAKYPTPDKWITRISLPLFLVTLARSQQAPEIFKLTPLCNIIKKVEAHRSQKGLTQCYNCQRFGHILVHCRQPPRSLWCGGGHHHHECPEEQNSESVPACCIATCKKGESPHPQSCKTGVTALKERTGDNTRVSKEKILL